MQLIIISFLISVLLSVTENLLYVRYTLKICLIHCISKKRKKAGVTLTYLFLDLNFYFGFECFNPFGEYSLAKITLFASLVISCWLLMQHNKSRFPIHWSTWRETRPNSKSLAISSHAPY